jgi:hypothetical protein
LQGVRSPCGSNNGASRENGPLERRPANDNSDSQEQKPQRGSPISSLHGVIYLNGVSEERISISSYGVK